VEGGNELLDRSAADITGKGCLLLRSCVTGSTHCYAYGEGVARLARLWCTICQILSKFKELRQIALLKSKVFPNYLANSCPTPLSTPLGKAMNGLTLATQITGVA
jgi:hypothetical protein